MPIGERGERPRKFAYPPQLRWSTVERARGVDERVVTLASPTRSPCSVASAVEADIAGSSDPIGCPAASEACSCLQSISARRTGREPLPASCAASADKHSLDGIKAGRDPKKKLVRCLVVSTR